MGGARRGIRRPRHRAPARGCRSGGGNPNGIKAARDSGAHVLCVTDVREVNYANIMHKIAELEAAHA